MKLFALVSSQGTACAETCLCLGHFTLERQTAIEQRAKRFTPKYDAPDLSKGWNDVTENEVCTCNECGYPNLDTGE